MPIGHTLTMVGFVVKMKFNWIKRVINLTYYEMKEWVLKYA